MTSVQKEVQKVCFVSWLFPESYINLQKAKRYKVVQFRENFTLATEVKGWI